MTIEQLQPFCSNDGTRYQIMKPWTRDGYTYATNARLCIRVPAMPEVAENPEAPDAATLGWGQLEGAQFGPLRHPTFKENPCECECGNQHTFKTYYPQTIGNRVADGEFLALIATLPNAEIDQREVADGTLPTPFAFRFDGGEGLLMPMRKP